MIRPLPPNGTPPETTDRRDATPRLPALFLGLIAFALTLFLLVAAKFILISLTTAIIVFSLTSEAINAIARLRIGPAHIPMRLASLVALLLIAAGLFTLSALLLSQANEVVTMALTYTEPASRAIAELFRWMGPDIENAVLSSLRSTELPGYLRAVAGQAGSLLSGTILVILFVGFLFAERVWFFTKLVNLLGDAERAERTGTIIESIMRRVNHYLLVKTGVSATTGVAVYAIFTVAGFDLALPVAILTFVLNFIPSLGSIVATCLAALVVYVQTGDARSMLAVLAGVGVVQFIIGNIIDPMLMGRALRLSSFGIIISLAFWGAVWGLPGMFLAVPIMVAVMIVCSHIPGLRPLAVLLSREGLPETEAQTVAALNRR
ncbi:AI-2E family transporter [Phaeovulum sp. W22_SRMD_FR3]|uniref:AI-2E family transporter n=1 Tax=Phaeovulum sp. W22_SRMD_FR3 TaxID=3240274 RepID=UPI003F94A387